MRADLSTGDLARATSNTLRTIRFYEEQGLLKPSVVSGGGHRRYTTDDLGKLRFILDLRELGLSLCEIKSVLELRAGCHSTAEFAARLEQALEEHVLQAQRRIERLRCVKKELIRALDTIRKRIASGVSTTQCPCSFAGEGDPPGIVKMLSNGQGCPHRNPSASESDIPGPS
jgi:DNA-binding transcriptional MerR regulator